MGEEDARVGKGAARVGEEDARAHIQSLSKEKLTLFYNDVCRDTITDFRCMEMMLGVVAADIRFLAFAMPW